MNTYLDSELKKKNEELLSYKKEINDKTIDITHQLENLQSENERLTQLNTSYEEKVFLIYYRLMIQKINILKVQDNLLI